MDKTITVVGSGVAYAMPDTAVVNGEIVGTVADYSEAVRSSAEAITTIRKSIGEAGFDMDDLRTTSFSVDTVYRNGSSGTVEFSGYRYMHGISISTDADGESLGRLLQALTSCEQAPEFRDDVRRFGPQGRRVPRFGHHPVGDHLILHVEFCTYPEEGVRRQLQPQP